MAEKPPATAMGKIANFPPFSPVFPAVYYCGFRASTFGGFSRCSVIFFSRCANRPIHHLATLLRRRCEWFMECAIFFFRLRSNYHIMCLIRMVVLNVRFCCGFFLGGNVCALNLNWIVLCKLICWWLSFSFFAFEWWWIYYFYLYVRMMNYLNACEIWMAHYHMEFISKVGVYVFIDNEISVRC